MSKTPNSNQEALSTVFKIVGGLEYEVDANSLVTILKKQDHKIQKFFRKLKFRIPEYRRESLDEFGSYVFLQIDGKKTVKEIGERSESKVW